MAKRFWQTLWFKLAAGFLLLALAVGLGAGAYMKYRYFPQASYDTVPPELPEFQGGPRVLVFSKTNGYRHLEAIPAANALLQRLAQKNGWNVFVTENAAIHNRDDLGQFDLLVWANVSGDVLTTEQREVFQRYIETGGSVLALHATGGDPSYEWDWHPPGVHSRAIHRPPDVPAVSDRHCHGGESQPSVDPAPAPAVGHRGGVVQL